MRMNFSAEQQEVKIDFHTSTQRRHCRNTNGAPVVHEDNCNQIATEWLQRAHELTTVDQTDSPNTTAVNKKIRLPFGQV